MRKHLIFGLSLLGLFDSTYLWWVYTSPSRPLVCLGTGCDVVRASSYAHLWGLPLPIYGVIMYAILALLAFAEVLVSAGLALAIRYGVSSISGTGFLAALYLTGIEGFVLHAWCAWCVLSALVVTFIFALSTLEIIRLTPHPEPAGALSAARKQFVLFVIALLVGIPAFIHLSRSGELPPMQKASSETLTERLVRPDSHATGNPQSLVTVVEFGDFECPTCGSAEETLGEIRKKYGDQIRLVFRQFPVSALHRQAEEAAEASECAAEQGKFWEAVEKLYANQSDLSDAALRRYAAELGLDLDRFNQCLTNQSMAERVRRDLADGRALGVRGTPTFFIDQRAIEGAPTLAEFAQVIEQELATRGATVAQSRAQQTMQGNQAQVKPNPSSPAPGAAKPAPGSSSAAPDLLANGSGGIFTQFQKSPLACSEDELKQQQPTLIRTPEARQLFESSSSRLFVDVRNAKDFAGARIPGSINVPVDQIGQQWASLPKEKTIVLYESGHSGATADDVCAFSRAAGRILLVHGFNPQQVKVYQDGLAGWKKAGLPVQR